MKKLLAILLAAVMLLSLTACGAEEMDDPAELEDPILSQSEENPAESITDDDNKETETAKDAEIPTEGVPLGWPENEYTALVPTPDVGGKVLTSGEVGELFAIELKWDMQQGLAYARQLQDAGFGEDCIEKYEKYGYIDRTANNVNVQLMDLFGVTSLSIMPVPEEADTLSNSSEAELYELWSKLVGYWNNHEGYFAVPDMEDNHTAVFRHGLWETEFDSGYGRVIELSATDERELTALVCWDTEQLTVIIDYYGLEEDGTIQIKIGQEGWMLYRYAGSTSEEAFESYVSN